MTMTISGTDYTLEPESTMELRHADGESVHKGDVLAISRIALGDAVSDLYVPVGVRYEAKFQSTSQRTDQQGSWDFIDNNTIYVGGEDHRLNYGEIVIEPNLQEKGNRSSASSQTTPSRYKTAHPSPSCWARRSI